MTNPPPFRGMCAWCKKEVWAHHVVKQQIGWITSGSTLRGPNRRDTGQIMHEVCHDFALLRERSKQIPGQLTIE